MDNTEESPGLRHELLSDLTPPAASVATGHHPGVPPEEKVVTGSVSNVSWSRTVCARDCPANPTIRHRVVRSRNRCVFIIAVFACYQRYNK